MLGNITWLLKQIVEKLSSNINEVIRQVLNFLLFFYKKILHAQKAQNRLQRTKIRNVYEKHLSSKINEVIKFFNQFRLDNLVKRFRYSMFRSYVNKYIYYFSGTSVIKTILIFNSVLIN